MIIPHSPKWNQVNDRVLKHVFSIVNFDYLCFLDLDFVNRDYKFLFAVTDISVGTKLEPLGKDTIYILFDYFCSTSQTPISGF